MKFSANKLKASFGYAWSGISNAFRSEQNLRIHCSISIVAIAAAAVLDFSVWRYCVLFLVIASVLSLELMNTAIENAVDLTTDDIHPLAKKAKDAAAGAVLVFSLFAVIIGILLFFQPAVEMIKQWNAGR
ncbi:diacylglycerol kinase family protein [Fictibacillus iocasae]|uniref:Diacylglycerol kinase family protein n=1 Tax=Fictibacillus iocasae TaxID=2715437 RepID=A0ABW2NTF8_9BACL